MAVNREPLGVFDFRYRTIAQRQAARLDEDPALPDEYRYMVGANGVVRALERLAAAARERAIPFVVFDVKPQPGLTHSMCATNCVMANASSSSERAGAWDFTS